VLALTKFPVQVDETGTMLDETAFVGQYDKVWNSSTINAVLSQDPEKVRTGDHFVIGCGEV
jgi:hypothetical protein